MYVVWRNRAVNNFNTEPHSLELSLTIQNHGLVHTHRQLLRGNKELWKCFDGTGNGVLITYINWLVTKMANRKPRATIKLLVRDILRFKLNSIQLAIAKKLSNNNNKQHPFDGAECSKCSRLDKAPRSTFWVFGTRYYTRTVEIPLFILVSISMLLVLSSTAKAPWWTYLGQSSIFDAHIKTHDWQEAKEE